MSEALLQLAPWLVPWARRLLAQARSPVSLTSVRRSTTQQTLLYRRYLAGQHPYPVAPPGKSKHEQGLAWDMVGTPEELRRLGLLWKSWGGRWGGDFRDPIHFEGTPTMQNRAATDAGGTRKRVSTGAKSARQVATSDSRRRRGRRAAVTRRSKRR